MNQPCCSRGSSLDFTPFPSSLQLVPFFFFLLSLTKLNYSFEKGTLAEYRLGAISRETRKNNKDGYLPPIYFHCKKVFTGQSQCSEKTCSFKLYKCVVFTKLLVKNLYIDKPLLEPRCSILSYLVSKHGMQLISRLSLFCSDSNTHRQRHIIFDALSQVQTPPEWVKLPGPVKGIEKEKAEFACESSGIPNPHYTWVDQYGIDATDKEG